jgi:UDP-glucose 4-epimerase
MFTYLDLWEESAMKTIITGGAGFIGSHLASNLSKLGEVIIVDDFSTGDLRFLEAINPKPRIRQIDLSKNCVEELTEVFMGASTIYHMAANADVRGGWSNSNRDIEQNILATHHVAESARRANVAEIIFASTGCVYGDSTLIPTPETEPFPIQTSLYGMSKVSAEGILSAYAMQGVFKVSVFRFVSVLGPNYHHGHVIDFVRQLHINPNSLNVLGNGEQKKSYVHVADCVSALMTLRSNKQFESFNVGHDYYISVRDSANLVSKAMGLTPDFIFGSGSRGWVGDNPFTFLDISKAKSFGWSPMISIEHSLEETVRFIQSNEWILKKTDYRG